MATQPLVTFITATYNTAPYLRETIDSVLAQTYANIEYIVLDDGSTDDTIDILKSYGDRITWTTHPNMGETRTVNKGFGMAKGDYIVVVSADDPVKPRLAEVAVPFMEARPDILVGYPGWDIIDSQSTVIDTPRMFDYNYDQMLRWHYCMPGPGTFIRRRAIELEQGRNTDYRYIGDYEFWVRLGLRGDFAYIPHNLATWRFHAASTSVNQRNARMAEEHIRLFETFYQRTDLPESVLQARAEALSTAYYVAALMLLPADLDAARPYLIRSFKLFPFAPRRYPTGLIRSKRYQLVAFFPFLRRALITTSLR